MSAVASNAGLIAAGANLAEVQAVIGAINGANANASAPAAGLAGPTSSGPAAEFTPGVTQQQVCYAPRVVIHPTPRYLPRPVLHPTPRYEPAAGAAPSAKSRPPHITPPPPPPWMIPQAMRSVPALRDIKLPPGQPDYISRGRLIDLFM